MIASLNSEKVRGAWQAGMGPCHARVQDKTVVTAEIWIGEDGSFFEAHFRCLADATRNQGRSQKAKQESLSELYPFLDRFGHDFSHMKYFLTVRLVSDGSGVRELGLAGGIGQVCDGFD